MVLLGLRLQKRHNLRPRALMGVGLRNVRPLACQQILQLVKVRSLFEYPKLCQALLIEFGQPELNPCPLVLQRHAQAGCA